MGGLAQGSWLAGLFSERRKSLLLMYAVVELIVGVVALLFHDLFVSLIEVFFFTVLPSIGTLVAAAARTRISAGSRHARRNYLLQNLGSPGDLAAICVRDLRRQAFAGSHATSERYCSGRLFEKLEFLATCPYNAPSAVECGCIINH